MSIGELITIKKESWQRQWRVVRRYYPTSWRFALSDLALGLASCFFNAYRVCRKQGTIYGETPIESLRRIGEYCSLTANDCWLELGSGRGKGAFWIAHFVGCRTIGVEKVPIFFWIANGIRTILGIRRLSFVHADMADADFSKASCVYLYSTCMEDAELVSLCEKMKALPPHAKVVTISAPLPENESFHVLGSFPISFPWGETEAYLNERVENEKTH